MPRILAASLYAAFDERSPDRPPGECWLWHGTITGAGYAVFGYAGKQHRASRVAYERWVGPIPEGLVVDHVKARGCTHRHCVNPDHLEAVENGENVRRGDAPSSRNRDRDRCIRNHLFDEVRRVKGREYRACSQCRLEKNRRYASGVGSGRRGAPRDASGRYLPDATR